MNDWSMAILSRRPALLRGLLGRRITKLVHFSSSSPREISDYHEVPAVDVFSFADGPLVLSVDSGLALGFGTQDSLNSVTVWTEQTEAGEEREDHAEGDLELLPIASTNGSLARPFWGRLIGHRVASIEIFVRRMEDPRYESLPNEAAVVVTVDDGNSFFLAHNLLDVSEDFLVLQEEQIPKAVLRQLDSFLLLSVESN
ncbi:hypothetical protein G6O69_01115 [Pseudenhygromyxa sp. WMMC2535]|uniref:hypothetical protein n=1 Tax=Pseudenhygromyxa sp. WMMC2535 TaxID=2712867 RepID=UPI001555D475|nr:hypothetical protein [Pseudenhygromyxa sp. WMMC2535]NVB36411.1 hypothetical protein [Pseudenhygromyxa sp. WMMC2535]